MIGIPLFLIAWLSISYVIAWKLTSRARAPFPEPAPAVEWGPLVEQRFATSDGEQVGAWYARGRDEDAPSVLLLHGNGGSRWNSLGRAKLLATRIGCSVLLLSLRAHGDSTGQFNDFGLSARHDVIAAVAHLREQRPGRPIIVLGVSLGSAAAIFAAGELGGQVQGYILESPYQDLKTAVWHRTETYLPPLLDRIAYLGLRIAGTLRLPNLDQISLLEAIKKVPQGLPILILSGADDTLAQPSEAFALHKQVPAQSRVEIIPKGRHNNLFHIDPPRYAKLVTDFIARAQSVK